MSGLHLPSLHFDATMAWLVLGFVAQGVFGARFLVQWLASERARASVIPVAFWYLSIVGGLMLLCYAIHRRDPVFIVGEMSGVFIYARNLRLLRQRRADAGGLAP